MICNDGVLSFPMTRPKIKTALVIVLVSIGLIFAGFSAFALSRLSDINQNTADIAANWMPSLAFAKDADNAFTDLRVAWRNHVIASTTERMDRAESDAADAKLRLTKALSDYDSLSPTQDELQTTRKIRDELAKFDQLIEPLKVASAAHDDAAAEQIILGDMEPIRTRVDEALAKLIDFNTKGEETSYEASQAAYQQTILVTILLLVTAAGVISGSIWFAVSGIARPINRIADSMNRLANGDVASPIPYAGRADEIGEMAAAVEVFRTNVQNNAKLENEAAAQRNRTEEERRVAAEQDRLRAEAMAQATTGLADGLKHLASGDLTFELPYPFAQEFESLRNDFNLAVTQLRSALSGVAQAGSSIDGSAQEVSRSAEDLSKRTEQQAASLEETAAALDQITANVSNSSKRAEEARSVAVEASSGASQSGKVVANAVEAMHKIEESSSKVSNIIGVIDEIAFQTNLLALNAGVEAARAGEAGKGFAVVAQEVRELAQRSAQAAKEIKELIRNSSIEVEIGVKLVSETGSALATISQFIASINEHMDAIATSAREQSVGLSEVNTAINQMDQVTQQNAAMVEETNASGATLATEAGKLREMIGQFQLRQPGAMDISKAASLRRTSEALALVSPASAPLTSPAHSMVGRIAKAFTGRTSVVAPADEWEEF